MISACFCLLLAVVFFSMPVKAEESGEWEYTADNNQVTITAYHGSEKKLEIPNALGGYKVVAIGNGVFRGSTTLESVTFPDTLTTIGDNAFSECSSLTEITLSNALTSIGRSAFASSKLKSVVIPDSVTYIGAYAFDKCTGLRSVTLGSGITEWETDWSTNAAFRGCTLLTELTIPEGVTSIGPYAFQGCTLLMEAEIPSTVTEISEGAFADCELLDTISIYGSIGNSAFKNCTSLKDVTLDEVYTIGDEAFAGDTALKMIELPEMLTSVGSRAFEGCTKLKEILIPENVSFIGAYAFRSCTQLETAVLNSGITSWGTDWSNNEAFSGCTKLTDLTIMDGCAYIPQNCFLNCTALETVEIPGSCESIDAGAFKNCTALEEVILNEGICYINAEAFNEDTALVKADLPESLLSVENYAFHNTRLRHVRIPDKVMTIGYFAFSDNPALRTVYIGESVETWNTDWGTNGAFRNDIRLESLEIAEGCMYIGSYAFNNCISLTEVDIPITATAVNEGAFLDCTSLTHVSILRGEIGDKAFMGCTALSDLSLKRITEIKSEAFRGCSALYELELPDTVTAVGNNAFYGCVSLSTLYIPESVTYLGAYAFAECTGLLTVDISNNITEWGSDWGDCRVFYNDSCLQYAYVDDTANSLGNQLFRGCESLKGVYLPESIVSYSKDLFIDCPEDLVVYGKGSKMEKLAEENGVNFSKEDFVLPEFETVTLSITAGEGGIIAPMGEIEKPIGSKQAITIVPAFGYIVDNYTVDGYKYDYWDTLVDIQEDTVIEVTFVEDPDYVEEYPLLDEDEAEPEDDAEEEPEDGEPEDTEPEDEEPEEEPGDAVESEEEADELLGRIDEAGDYVNEFLNLKFHAEDDWTFLSREEILEMNGFTAALISDEELAESMQKALEDGTSVACMSAMAPLGSPNVNLNLQRMDGAAAFINEQAYLELIAMQLESTLASVGGKNCEYEITTVQMAGEEVPCIQLYWELYTIPVYQCAAIQKADNYMAVITATSMSEGEAEQLMGNWSRLD